MKEHPLIFIAPMVRAILNGRKTQTRRVMRQQPNIVAVLSANVLWRDSKAELWRNKEQYTRDCCKWKPHDFFWVKENFQWIWKEGVRQPASKDEPEGWNIGYVATEGRQEFYDNFEEELSNRIAPSIHMPRWASRIIREIVAVRAEQLQDISEADAIAEGIRRVGDGWGDDGTIPLCAMSSAANAYARLWNSINEKTPGKAWSDNPWVWVIEWRNP